MYLSPAKGDILDYMYDFAIAKGSALDVWMSINKRIILYKKLISGYKFASKTWTDDMRKDYPEWLQHIKKTMKAKGWKYFASEFNVDSGEAIFIKK